MWIVCITSVRHVLTVNGYGGRQTKENEKSWCFKGWETLAIQFQFARCKLTAYVLQYHCILFAVSLHIACSRAAY